MPWKTDSEGNVIIENNNPVFVHPDGREEQFNGDSALIRLGELKNEAKERRQKYSALKEQVKPLFDAGVEDIASFVTAGKEAIDLVESYKSAGSPNAQEIEQIKLSVKSTFDSQIIDQQKRHQKELDSRDAIIAQKDSALRTQLIKSEFDSSPFIRDKTYLIPELAYNTFGKHFVVEDNDGKPKTFAIDDNGEKIFSLKGSSYADPQEAIEILIQSHPQKDKFLRSSSGGSGAIGGNDRKPFTGRTINTADSAAASQNLEKIATGEVVVTR